MRRNSSTVVVLAGAAPGEVLAAVGRSMNVTLIRPEEPADSGGDGMAAAADALQRAGRATSPYALVAADPLAAVAVSWRAMWDVSRQEGPAEFEQEAAKALAAWRAGRFELPDYYLVLASDTGASGAGRSQARLAPRAVALVPAAPGSGGRRGGARAAGRRCPAGPRLTAARSLVAGPGRSDRNGPNLLSGQPGRRRASTVGLAGAPGGLTGGHHQRPVYGEPAEVPILRTCRSRRSR